MTILSWFITATETALLSVVLTRKLFSATLKLSKTSLATTLPTAKFLNLCFIKYEWHVWSACALDYNVVYNELAKNIGRYCAAVFHIGAPVATLTSFLHL